MLALYMDEQVEKAITRGLARRGVDVLRVQDDGHGQTDDSIILDRAAVIGRVVFTRDRDFLAIAQHRQANGIPFVGVIFADAYDVSIGRCVNDLEIAAGVYSLADMADWVEYLPL